MSIELRWQLKFNSIFLMTVVLPIPGIPVTNMCRGDDIYFQLKQIHLSHLITILIRFRGH